MRINKSKFFNFAIIITFLTHSHIWAAEKKPFSPSFSNSTLETAVARYIQNDLNSTTMAMQTTTLLQSVESKGYETGLDLGLSYNTTNYADHSNLIVEDQLDGETKLNTRSYNLGISQGIGVGQTIRISGGRSASQASQTQFWGADYIHWFLYETIRVTVGYGKTMTDQEVIDFPTTDLQSVVTPDRLTGTNSKLDLMFFMTPTTILKTKYEMLHQSHRPVAKQYDLELRQFFESTHSAIWVSGMYYDNTGETDTRSVQGSVEAYSYSVTANQKLPQNLIMALRYRYYEENETPRSDEDPLLKTASDDYKFELRWRMVDQIWTNEASEIYFFANHYKNNRDTTGNLFGLGQKFLLN